MINLNDRVMVTRSYSERGVSAGEVGWVTVIHGGGAGFSVEFADEEGHIKGLVIDESKYFSLVAYESRVAFIGGGAPMPFASGRGTVRVKGTAYTEPIRVLTTV